MIAICLSHLWQAALVALLANVGVPTQPAGNPPDVLESVRQAIRAAEQKASWRVTGALARAAIVLHARGAERAVEVLKQAREEVKNDINLRPNVTDRLTERLTWAIDFIAPPAPGGPS
jgi:hypothetical protein